MLTPGELEHMNADLRAECIILCREGLDIVARWHSQIFGRDFAFPAGTDAQHANRVTVNTLSSLLGMFNGLPVPAGFAVEFQAFGDRVSRQMTAMTDELNLKLKHQENEE